MAATPILKNTTYRLTPEESEEMNGAEFLINAKLPVPELQNQAGVTVLIDVSASMGDDAVRICRFMTDYVGKLSPLTEFAMILFGDVPELVLSTTGLTEEERKRTCARLNSFQKRELHNCTNLEAGLDLANQTNTDVASFEEEEFEMLGSDGSPFAKSTSLILLLDGCVNAGERRYDRLLAKASRYTTVVNIMFGTHASHEFSHAINTGLENGKSYFVDPSDKEFDLDARLMEAWCANPSAKFKVGSFEKEMDPSTLYNGNSYFLHKSSLVDEQGKAAALDEITIDAGVYGKASLSSTLIESRSASDEAFVKMAIQAEKIRIRLNRLCNDVKSMQDSIDENKVEAATGEADALISALDALSTKESEEPCYRSLSCVMREQTLNIKRGLSTPTSVVPPTGGDPNNGVYRSLGAGVGDKRPRADVDENTHVYRSLGDACVTPASSPVCTGLIPHRMVSVRDV